MKSSDGKNEALGQLVHSFIPYIERKTKQLNVPGLEQDDLKQEALIALFFAIDSYDESRDTLFSTYAIQCINNRLTDTVRAAMRKKHKPLNESITLSDGKLDVEIPTTQTPEELYLIREEVEQLQNRIGNELSKKEREVLFYWLDGLSYEEIGKKMGYTSTQVGNALQRAKKKLKS